jgi:heme ABC exporter ATP-binding subunit CcmA
MVAAVRLRAAVALLGGFPVLAGADLEVHPGEVVLLQGANGAGKTSLLRTCAGLLPVVSGSAEVLGCDLTVDRRAVRRRVGLMGHATALYDDLTVEDNVRFAVRAAGGAIETIEPALVRLGLAGRLRSVPAGRLSAGQRRRTALAVLVARQPELWLLDEPHAGLDAEHRDLLDDLIRGAVAAGAAVVLASHERDRASALAHRTLTMAGGQVVPARPPAAPTVAGGQVVPARPPAALTVAGGQVVPARPPAALTVAGGQVVPARPPAAPTVPGVPDGSGASECRAGDTGIPEGSPETSSAYQAAPRAAPMAGSGHTGELSPPLDFEAAHVA